MNISMKKQPFFAILIMVSFGALANDSVMRGKALYDTVCFACHGKLEGAAGPNLKDYEWLHGGNRDQIITSITKGFPEKGMVAFGVCFPKNRSMISRIFFYRDRKVFAPLIIRFTIM